VGLCGVLSRSRRGRSAWLAQIPLELVRRKLPVVLPPGRDAADGPSENLGLGRVRNPRGKRNQKIAVIDERKKKHQLLRAGSDQNLGAGPGDALAAAMVLGHRFPQGCEPAHREVMLLVGVLRSAATTGSGTGNGD